nr:ABC transporter ATP-binding protein [Cutibacterium avidum]
MKADAVSVGYGDRAVLDHLDLSIPTGRIGAIIGPNGCGKSTLLRTMTRLIRPSSGQVVLDGQELPTVPTRQLARIVGLLPQSPTAPTTITVADLVARGRAPHQGIFGRWTTDDEQTVASALERTGIVELARRPVDELSGGQRQRVWIAMALAQNTDVLFLDEPTTYLDLAHQIDVLSLLRDLNRRDGVTIVMVLHDINMAARYCDWLVAMRDGEVRANGTPTEVITADVMREVFGLRTHIIHTPDVGTPIVIPIDTVGVDDC